MSDEPRLQLGVLGPDRIKDDHLIRFHQTPDMQDGSEDHVSTDEDGRDEVGGHGVYATEVTRLSGGERRKGVRGGGVGLGRGGEGEKMEGREVSMRAKGGTGRTDPPPGVDHV